MKVTHTPGPWEVDGEGCRLAGVGNVNFADFVSLTNISAPCVSAHHEPSDEERAANALIIAASPDMLQALREVAGGCHALDTSTDESQCVFCLLPEGHHDPDCTMQFVLAAIAKAEGLRT